MDEYLQLKSPPKWALKTIGGGRLRGMTDINPQWRYEIMTDVYGQCGVGWKFEVVKKWTECGPDGQVCAFVDVNLYTHNSEKWSEPIPGTGGSMFVAKERDGLYVSDECWKMATTDALSTAMKMIGVAADIYAGRWDGSKYRETAPSRQSSEVSAAQLNNLKISWKEAYADQLGDQDRDAMANSFEGWVKRIVDRKANWNVQDYTQWRQADLAACEKAIKERA